MSGVDRVKGASVFLVLSSLSLTYGGAVGTMLVVRVMLSILFCLFTYLLCSDGFMVGRGMARLLAWVAFYTFLSSWMVKRSKGTPLYSVRDIGPVGREALVWRFHS